MVCRGTSKLTNRCPSISTSKSFYNIIYTTVPTKVFRRHCCLLPQVHALAIRTRTHARIVFEISTKSSLILEIKFVTDILNVEVWFGDQEQFCFLDDSFPYPIPWAVSSFMFDDRTEMFRGKAEDICVKLNISMRTIMFEDRFPEHVGFPSGVCAAIRIGLFEEMFC